MLHRSLIPTALLAACLVSPALAQGSDDCATAQPIAGVGAWSFDNTSATAAYDPALGPFAEADHDVWFLWTPSVAGTYWLSTCGSTSVDTVLEVYSQGACPGTSPTSLSDDACSSQSATSIIVTTLLPRMVRIAAYPGTVGGVGTLDITLAGPPPTCATLASGADLVAHQITSVTNWGIGTNTAGQPAQAFSFGHTVCNLGDAQVAYVANSTGHPIFTSNLYRHRDGRFEQVGMSWAMHGFAALAGAACCSTCAPAGTVAALGVACSDTSSASIQGSQGALGPRSEIDPVTGAFPMPFTGQGAAGLPTADRRLQVAHADLSAPQSTGATYYGEIATVAADDASAGNRRNNYAHRRFNLSGNAGSGFNLQTLGQTKAQQPALVAWATHDPEVRIEPVDVLGDGRFLVASLCTDNGDGTWHYEYAVMNQDSARGLRSFVVPLPAGAVITNVGFHDVAHHSGELYAGTDWSVQQSATSLAWSTDDFATDANANALRWGTLYNFRFDADVAPMEAEVQGDLFAPGIPATLSAGACVPRAPLQIHCSPANLNSAGTFVTLVASSLGSGVGSGLHLEATGGPPFEFAFVLMSTDGSGNLPLFGGVLCLGIPLGRYNLNVAQNQGLPQLDSLCMFDAAGVMQNLVGTASSSGGSGYDVPLELPLSPAGQLIAPGTNLFLQVWYRNGVLPPVGPANFSDMLEARF